MKSNMAIFAILGSIVLGAGLVFAVFQFSGAMDVTGDQTPTEEDMNNAGELQVSQFPITLGYELPTDVERNSETVDVYLATEEHKNWGNHIEYDSSDTEVDELYDTTVTGDTLAEFQGWNQPGDLYAVAVSSDYHTTFAQNSLDEWVNENYFSESNPYRIDAFRNMDAKGTFQASSAQIFDVDDEQTGFSSSADSVTIQASDDRVEGTFTVENGTAYLGEVDVTVPTDREVDVTVLVDGTEEYTETVDDEGDTSDLAENMETDPLVAEDEVQIVVDGAEGLASTEEVVVDVMDIYESGETASMTATVS